VSAGRGTRDADTLERAVAAFAARRASVSPDARVLIALSGGPDSCALLLLLVNAARRGLLPVPVGVAHFHHGLRGADADGDAAFSAALAARHGLPCVIGLGKVEPGGRAPYDAARRDRYAFLQEAAREWDATRIATAHTADDQAETVLGRVLRGSSVDGLAGIPTSRALAPGLLVVRPLLETSRAEVEAYNAAHGVTGRQDPSNADDRRPRARLRKRLPELAAAFNPRLTDALCRLAESASADSDLLTELAEDLYARAVLESGDDRVRLDRETLRSAPPALRRRAWRRALWRLVGADPIGTEVATGAWIAYADAFLTGEKTGVPEDLPGGVRLRVTVAEVTVERTRTR
jgi:tRNA(Ile)-lysidine synthase